MIVLASGPISHISRATFNRGFRSATGTTPARVLRAARLQKARRLLRETDQAIASIASACGFQDPNYFAVCFRREFRQTPAAYRRASSPK